MSDRYRDQRAVYGAPPPPRERKPCHLCGEAEPLALADRCCWKCASFANHIPALGWAIARFVRNTEVEALVYEATDACLKFGDTPEYEASILLKHAARHGAALRRLAQLAKGES